MSDDTIQKMTKAAKAGGEVLKKYFGQTLDITEKSTLWDFQTKADLESEKIILEILQKEFPGYNIHAEEEGETNNNSEYTLIVDPMDGTNNFVVGIPNFVVTVALKKNETIEAGVIYAPIIEQVYYAAKGQGAFMDGVRLQLSKETDPKKATIGYSGGYLTPRQHISSLFNKLLIADHKRIMFNWASANDYCLLASGRIEGFINEETQVYDFAAGKLIAREAGAIVTDWQGKESKDLENSFIIANNKIIHNHLLKIINN